MYFLCLVAIVCATESLNSMRKIWTFDNIYHAVMLLFDHPLPLPPFLSREPVFLVKGQVGFSDQGEDSDPLHAADPGGNSLPAQGAYCPPGHQGRQRPGEHVLRGTQNIRLRSLQETGWSAQPDQDLCWWVGPEVGLGRMRRRLLCAVWFVACIWHG